MTDTRNRPPVTYAPPDWADESIDRAPSSNQLARSRQTYVTAAPARYEPPTLARGDQAITLDVAPTATTHVEVTGDHLNRARAWLRYSIPLCLSFALVIVVLACLFTPIMDAELGWAFLRMVGLYLGMFVASYVAMFRFYLSRSPEGLAYRQSERTWDFLEREQAHRHSIEKDAWRRYIEGKGRQ